ncbi:hypothetical protein [Metamycoplasma hominis]|uniref:hypothetical protein n=1 Tax=Metamycoplasma hominis TaxID=2098 RepID=UPI003CE713D8
MSKYFYRLRGSQSIGKNAKTYSFGSAQQYNKALIMAQDAISKNQFKEVQIERIQVIKIIKQNS